MRFIAKLIALGANRPPISLPNVYRREAQMSDAPRFPVPLIPLLSSDVQSFTTRLAARLDGMYH